MHCSVNEIGLHMNLLGITVKYTCTLANVVIFFTCCKLKVTSKEIPFLTIDHSRWRKTREHATGIDNNPMAF